uniref:MAPK activated protein kinase 5 n=1 Tax=Saimiri boliviensis boliviensis TaxID=39432 RepID=A0A2K6S8Y2_SAIBB
MSEESDMEKAIKAASICFRMVCSAWRVGIYPFLPFCLKSAFWKSAVRRKH